MVHEGQSHATNGHAVEAQTRFALIPEWVINRNVSGNAVKLYAILARHVDQPRSAFPTTDTLAQAMGLSRATVRKSVAELQSIGAVEVIPQWTDNGTTTVLPHGEYGDPIYSTTYREGWGRGPNLYKLHTSIPFGKE